MYRDQPLYNMGFNVDYMHACARGCAACTRLCDINDRMLAQLEQPVGRSHAQCCQMEMDLECETVGGE